MFRQFDIFLFTLERIWQHRVLVGWVLLGISVATSLALSLPLYVDSVYSELLATRLDEPPYGFRFRYLGAWNGNITQVDVDSASAVIQEAFVDTIGLPAERVVHYTRGGTWNLRIADSIPLGPFAVGSLEGAEDQMLVIDGVWPPEEIEDDTVVPVLMPEEMLFASGVQVGDTILAQGTGDKTWTMQVAALWRPVNPNDPAWIFTPKFFDQVFLIQEDHLWKILEGSERPVDEAAWYLSFDGSKVRTADVTVLLANIVEGQRKIDAVLPGIRGDLSPVDGLTTFRAEVDRLTQQLFLIILPVGGLVLYFVSLVAGLLVSRQQPEDVKLRSRGMSRRALLTIHILMWLLLVGGALMISIGVGPLLVRLVGRTTSFLRFDGVTSVLAVVLTWQAVGAAAITGLIAASTGLYLAWRTTGYSINTYRRMTVRATRTWWQRAYLDILLFGAGVYVLYTLWQQGGLITAADSPFSDPLTFLGPTLFSLGLTLVFLRLWPTLLGIGARVISYSRNIALLMAFRELTRSIARYRGVLLMMAFTLSLTGITASMASTIDRSLEDSISYRVGADLVLITAVDAETEEDFDAATGQTTLTVTGFNAPPIFELAALEGIASVSRVGRYSGRLVLRSTRIDGTILAVDRSEMAAVTHYRQDFSQEPISVLFNKLAGNRTGILLSRQTAEAYDLVVGQEVNMQISVLGTWYESEVPIIDLIDYFPTLDPNEGFFLIANMDPVFELAGTPLPYDVWLSLYSDADSDVVRQQIIAIGFPVLRWLEPEVALQEARAEPARRGTLGFLSVGFVASIMLTLIAAIIQNVSAFRAQATQLGALRAMGLGGLSVSAYMILLQGLAATGGILSGTSIGVMTSLLFLPLLDFSAGLPPYLVRVAWNEISVVYIVFAAILFVVTLLATFMLGRTQIAMIIKLGDT